MRVRLAKEVARLEAKWKMARSRSKSGLLYAPSEEGALEGRRRQIRIVKGWNTAAHGEIEVDEIRKLGAVSGTLV